MTDSGLQHNVDPTVANDATPVATTAPVVLGVGNEPAGDSLIQEIKEFYGNCQHRYKFNNRWDIVLSVLGILLSIAVVAAGFLRRPEFSAVLGAVVGAVLTAQKAFPFGQRATFYRLLIGQSENLITASCQGLVSKKDAVDRLTTLRMDFAQQLPRGSSSQTKDGDDGAPQPA